MGSILLTNTPRPGFTSQYGWIRTYASTEVAWVKEHDPRQETKPEETPSQEMSQGQQQIQISWYL
jgi:hypothetical protein